MDSSIAFFRMFLLIKTAIMNTIFICQLLCTQDSKGSLDRTNRLKSFTLHAEAQNEVLGPFWFHVSQLVVTNIFLLLLWLPNEQCAITPEACALLSDIYPIFAYEEYQLSSEGKKSFSFNEFASWVQLYSPLSDTLCSWKLLCHGCSFSAIKLWCGCVF